MNQKGTFKGLVSIVNKWGSGFKLEGRDSWLNFIKAYTDHPKISKGDMVEFEYSHDTDTAKTYVHKLTVLAAREPIVAETQPLIIPNTQQDKPSPPDQPRKPYTYNDKELIPSEVALEKAIMLFAHKVETPEVSFILFIASQFEKWIWDFNRRRALWDQRPETPSKTETPNQWPPEDHMKDEPDYDDTKAPSWDDIPPLDKDEDLPF